MSDRVAAPTALDERNTLALEQLADVALLLAKRLADTNERVGSLERTLKKSLSEIDESILIG